MKYFLTVVFVSASAFAELWRVPEDCETITQAIAAAEEGDTIEVGVGVWRERIDLLGKAVTLRSLMGAEETVIDGGGLGPVVRCINGESSSTVIEGFTITGGKNTPHGGGVLAINTSPSIRRCFIEYNEADKGGGLYVRGGNPIIDACVFSSNDAGDGDGIWAKHARPVLTACIFADDTIGWESGELVTIRDTNSPAGACCIRDVCVQTASVACWEAGGLYRGENSTCELACDAVCDEDVTGDGVVNMTDLLHVISAFGFCP
ncbi:MAG: hypothetical protein QGI78_07515 [Phycisphaerales bacterium]|jgi:hypothetical protein|nr:hypothetical protein [Phycisphaerales bacterium]